MRYLSLSELLQAEFSVVNLHSLIWEWNDGESVDYRNDGREHNLFFYQTGGSREYLFFGESATKTMKSGNMILISDQTHYLTRACTVDGRRCSGFNALFDLVDTQGELIRIKEPYVLLCESSQTQNLSLFRKLNYYINLYPPQPLLANANLLPLLHQFITASERINSPFPADQIILPALMKIHEALNIEHSISELCELCHISESTFRRKFKASTGMSPVRYRNLLRVRQAKLIYDELHISIEKIAEQLGFCDAPYLCRTYKQLTGKSFGDQ